MWVFHVFLKTSKLAWYFLKNSSFKKMRNYLKLNALCLHRFNRWYQGCEHQLNPEAVPSSSSVPSVVCARPFLYPLAHATSISYLTSYVVQTLKNKNSTLRLCCYRDICWLTSNLSRLPAYLAGFACFEMQSVQPRQELKTVPTSWLSFVQIQLAVYMLIIQRMSLKYKAGSTFFQQRLDSLKAISVNTHSGSRDNRPAVRRQWKPERTPTVPTWFPASMKTGIGCGEMTLESLLLSQKKMSPETQQTQTHSLAEGAGKSGDSERQGGSRVALGLRKESSPDVFSNGDLLKGLGPEGRVKWQALPKDFWK